MFWRELGGDGFDGGSMKNLKICLIISCLILFFYSTQVQAQTTDLNCNCTCSCQDKIATARSETIVENIAESFLNQPTTEIISAVSNEEETFEPPVKILISEIVSDPLTGEKEWVEIYNAGLAKIDLSGWRLVEGAGLITKLTGEILPGGYRAFDKSNLNNSGDIIILKNPAGEIVDQVVYGDWNDGNLSDNALAPTDPYSLIRKNLSVDTNVDSVDFVITKIPTKGLANIYSPIVEESTAVETLTPVIEERSMSETESVSAAMPKAIDVTEEITTPVTFEITVPKIRINEILPNPVGSDTGSEWIELYNDGNEAVNLAGWSLDDEEGGSAPFTIKEQVMIPAKGYAIFSNEQTKLILNNTADKVRLFDANKKLLDEISYSEVFEGQSYAYFPNGWRWTEALTPQSENSLSFKVASSSLKIISEAYAATSSAKKVVSKTDDKIITTTLDKIRSLPLGVMVKTRGYVSVAPGIFSNKIAYLKGSGIQLYNSKALWPDLKIGNYVEVIGKVSESLNERRLLVSRENITILDNLTVDLIPEEINSELVGEAFEGSLVQITGELIEKNRSRLVFSDAEGEYIVYLKSGTKIPSSLFEMNKRYKITGIVSQTEEEYRILPRGVYDVVNLTLMDAPALGEQAESKMVPTNQTKSSSLKILLLMLVTLIIIAGSLIWRYRELIYKKFMKLKFKFSKPVKVDFNFQSKSSPNVSE